MMGIMAAYGVLSSLSSFRESLRGAAHDLTMTSGLPEKLVLEHEMRGDDSPWLGPGFYPWEAETRARWASGRCVLQAELPRANDPYPCELRLTCWVPNASPPGGVSVFVNDVLAARVEDVYQKMAMDRDDNLVARFATFGGPLRIELLYDSLWKPADSRDQRDLAMVLRKLRIVAGQID
jgi:hypothetical protein